MTHDASSSTATSPFISTDTKMLSDVITSLDERSDLSPSRCRDLKSALRSIARLIGQPLQAIPANINWLHIKLRRINPAAHNMSKKRFSNIKSDALKAFELTGCSRKRSDWLRPASPGWIALFDSIEDNHDRWKLTQLAQFCSAQGIESTEITDHHPHALLKALVEESFVNRPEHVVANAIKTWNRLRDQQPGWPDIELRPLPPKKERWTFPIETFPASFQEDVEAWLERLRNPDLFDGTGPAKPLRPKTIAHRRFQIQEAASALVRSGVQIPKVTNLKVLVDLDHLKASLRWMIQRFDNTPTEAIQGVAVCLQAIARHHVHVEEPHLDGIRGIVKRLSRGADGLREKNRQRLLQLDDTDNLAKLLHLPATLVTKAERVATQKPRKAAFPDRYRGRSRRNPQPRARQQKSHLHDCRWPCANKVGCGSRI